MSIEKSHLTTNPKCEFWSLQKMEVLVLSFLSLPAYANGGDTLLQFSMQVGSIMYVLTIVYVFVSNAKARMMLLIVYLSLTVFAYLFALNPFFELSLLLTVLICSIIPLLSTIVSVILVGIWRTTYRGNQPNSQKA
jgi:hypothetical protein